MKRDAWKTACEWSRCWSRCKAVVSGFTKLIGSETLIYMGTGNLFWRYAGCAIAFIALTSFLAGCVEPGGYSEWQWKQYNPNYRPLPGDPNS